MNTITATIFRMETLYHQTNQLLLDVQILSQKLEKEPQNNEFLENEIQAKLNTISA